MTTSVPQGRVQCSAQRKNYIHATMIMEGKRKTGQGGKRGAVDGLRARQAGSARTGSVTSGKCLNILHLTHKKGTMRGPTWCAK